MSASVLSVRVDSDIKESFARLCEELGMSSSVAVNMFMRQMIRERSLPFTPSLRSAEQQNGVLSRDAIEKAVRACAAPREAIGTAILFGSYARGEANPQSDIDLRVIIDPDKRMGLFAISSFADELREMTGKEVDVVTSANLREDIAKAIQQEGVIIYERA